jgi:carbamoylphosphate synthase large subunit
MTRAILYIGGSSPQQLAVRSLCEAGFTVHVTDRSPNPACAEETPHVHALDATDIAGIAALASRLQQDGELVGAYGIADYAMPAIAAVNRMIGGRSAPPQAIMTMVDKDATKRALHKGGVPLPETLWAGAADGFELGACRMPDASVREFIVKPADVHASQGIARVPRDDADALATAVALAGKAARWVLIEEYLEGDIWNVDALAAGGVVYPVSVTRRLAHDRLAFLPCLQVQPGRAEEPRFAVLSHLARQVAESLDYHTGPFTIDLIMSESGPKVLEVSPHFHSIAMEILRGNGNPLRAWARYLAEDEGWREDLEAGSEQAGALAMLRAERCGVFVSIDGEDALACDPRCRNFVRLKRDGAEIRSLSASGGLLALAWWTAPQLDRLQADILERIDDFRPCFDIDSHRVGQ